MLVGGLIGPMAHIDIIVDGVGQVAQSCARRCIIPVNETDQPVLLKNRVVRAKFMMSNNLVALSQP